MEKIGFPSAGDPWTVCKEAVGEALFGPYISLPYVLGTKLSYQQKRVQRLKVSIQEQGATLDRYTALCSALREERKEHFAHAVAFAIAIVVRVVFYAIAVCGIGIPGLFRFQATQQGTGQKLSAVAANLSVTADAYLIVSSMIALIAVIVALWRAYQIGVAIKEIETIKIQNTK